MQIGCKYRIFMPLKPWGSSIVLIQGQNLPRVCVMQLCNFVQSWVTENMQKKWHEGKELGKIGENKLRNSSVHLKEQFEKSHSGS